MSVRVLKVPSVVLASWHEGRTEYMLIVRGKDALKRMAIRGHADASDIAVVKVRDRVEAEALVRKQRLS